MERIEFSRAEKITEKKNFLEASVGFGMTNAYKLIIKSIRKTLITVFQIKNLAKYFQFLVINAFTKTFSITLLRH